MGPIEEVLNCFSLYTYVSLWRGTGNAMSLHHCIWDSKMTATTEEFPAAKCLVPTGRTMDQVKRDKSLTDHTSLPMPVRV